MERARQQFEDLAKKVQEMKLSPEMMSSLPTIEKLLVEYEAHDSDSDLKTRWGHQVLTCGFVIITVLIIGALIPLSFMVLYEVRALPHTPALQSLHRHMTYAWLQGCLSLDIDEEECILENVEEIQDVFRPPVDCNICVNVTTVDRLSKLDQEEFVSKYAYSGRL